MVVFAQTPIEGNETVKSVLSFCQADEGVKIEPSIDIYRELKLRLLNGTHTFSCGLAFLAGFATVKEAMNHKAAAFISNLMLSDLAPAIPYRIPDKIAQRFGMHVLDRFRNPHLQHQWISITLQYSSKMKMRNIPTLLNYYRIFNAVPQYMALGFAAYLLFMKAVKKDGEKYYGETNGQLYLISDDQTAYFYEKWHTLSVEGLVTEVLGNNSLWDNDLTSLPGFADQVTEKLKLMLSKGALQTLENFFAQTALEGVPGKK